MKPFQFIINLKNKNMETNNDFNYTQSWFTSRDFEKHIKLDINNEIHILEIGSYEGKSSVWFIENMLKNPKSTITCVDPWLEYTQNSVSENTYTQTKNRDEIFNRFKSNISKTGKENNVNINRGYSFDVLKRLYIDDKKFDLIFIDGNHTSKFVLEDSVLSYSLLKKDGYIIWDDYLWKNPHTTSTELTTPKLGVDSFINCYKGHLDIIHKNYKCVVKKIK